MNMTEPVSTRTLSLLSDLIAFNTTSRLSNLELIDYVYELLKEQGLKPHVDYNRDKTKANLYTVIGPEIGGGVALSGHSDVVPVEGQDWDFDPWHMRQENGRVYGRGTTDMKGFIAVVLAALPDMLKTELKEPIHLCISHDEEVGCIGIRTLLSYLEGKPERPKSCIVGEPTDMDVVTGHKGKLGMRCQVKGFPCHSALATRGINSIHAAVLVIHRLMDMARDRRENGPFDPDFDVPFTTIHTGVIQGGTTLNIVPAECRFDFEFRTLPQEEPGELLRQVQDYADQYVTPELSNAERQPEFVWTELSRFPGLDSREEEAIVKLARRLTGKAAIKKVGFGTEAGSFSQKGIQSVVCGPGSIRQAHTANEFIELEQLVQCERFVADLIEELA